MDKKKVKKIAISVGIILIIILCLLIRSCNKRKAELEAKRLEAQRLALEEEMLRKAEEEARRLAELNAQPKLYSLAVADLRGGTIVPSVYEAAAGQEIKLDLPQSSCALPSLHLLIIFSSLQTALCPLQT